MAMYRFRNFALTASGNARAIQAGAVSAGFFEILRVQPALGRVFRLDEDTPGGKVRGDRERLILEDRTWRRV